MNNRRSLAAAFGAFFAFPSACVIENGPAPPYVPPPVTASARPPPPVAPEAAPAPEVAPPPPAPPPPAPPPAAEGPPSTTPAPEFTACKATSDCTLVPRNACCNNGFMEAVAAAKAEAYKASFTCATPGPCPMFRIRDTHTATCNPNSHRCELAAP